MKLTSLLVAVVMVAASLFIPSVALATPECLACSQNEDCLCAHQDNKCSGTVSCGACCNLQFINAVSNQGCQFRCYIMQLTELDNCRTNCALHCSNATQSCGQVVIPE